MRIYIYIYIYIYILKPRRSPLIIDRAIRNVRFFAPPSFRAGNWAYGTWKWQVAVLCPIAPFGCRSARLARIPDRLCPFRSRRFRFGANLRGTRDPLPHLLDTVGRSENRPRLSLENGATFVLKVQCFTVCLLAGSHRLRADAVPAGPRRAQSIPPKGSIRLRHGRFSDPRLQSKTSTLTVARLRFLPDPGPCPLQPPCPGGDAKVREKTRHFGHFGL